MKAVFKFLFSKRMMTFYGLVLISLLIWFLGPLLQIGGDKPLAPEWVRIAIIAVLFLIWFFLQFLVWLRIRRANKKMVQQIVEAEEVTSLTDIQSESEAAILRERFEEAMKVLRENAVRGRRGRRRYVYELPWYIIIGPPGSGKTTILRNSGLNFPLAEQLGTDSVEGIGGTRNCDWWFTDEAVLIDTAGRYTTQEVSLEVDRTAWRSFLDLLKHFRPRRPINGVIVTISLADILTQSAEERLVHVDAIRRRIEELINSFRMRLPVYVVFSKCDLVAGFSDFFDDLDAEERSHVLGMTFPFEKGNQAKDPLSSFNEFFDEILRRLTRRVRGRLHQEANVTRRGRIYTFPHQLAAIRGQVGQFLHDVFRVSRFKTSPILRGVYFSSGTQEGTPIDRLMRAYGETFRLSAEAPPAAAGRGKAFFIRDFLRRIVFPEAEIAGRNVAFERRMAWGYGLVYAGCAAIILTMAGLWYYTFHRTEEQAARLKTEISQIGELQKGLASRQTVEGVLPYMNVARSIGTTYPTGPILPWLANFGLSVDATVGPVAAGVYNKALLNEFRPRVANRVKERLQDAMRNKESLASVREWLRTYLELHDASHREPNYLRQRMTTEWNAMYPLQPERRTELANHFNALLTAMQGKNYEPDATVVQAARSYIIRLPRSEVVYQRLKEEAEKSTLPGIDITSVLGGAGQRVILSQGPQGRLVVPALYTRDGFYKIFLVRLPVLAQSTYSGDWVLGSQNLNTVEQQTTEIIRDAAKLYIKDYVAQWQGVIKSIQLGPITTPEDAANALDTLAGSTSPLVLFLNTFARNTDLRLVDTKSGTTPSGGSSGSGGSASAPKAPGAAEKLIGAAFGDNWPGNDVAKEFMPLINYASASGSQQPPITALQNRIAALATEVASMAKSGDGGAGAYKLAKLRAGGTTGGTTDPFTALSTAATRAPQPVRRVVDQVAEKAWGAVLTQAKEYVDSVWAKNVLPLCDKLIVGRYPVYHDASEETTLKDFATFFGPGGAIDKFTTDVLTGFISTGAAGWSDRTVNGYSLGLSTDAITNLQRAAAIKSAFFVAGGKEPQVKFTLTPSYLDPKAAKLTINVDDKIETYQHGPQRPTSYQWPSASGPGKVRLTLWDFRGRFAAVEKEGAWSWFRVMDQLEVQVRDGTAQFTLSTKLLGLEATMAVKSDSVDNPFVMPELRKFRCPATL